MSILKNHGVTVLVDVRQSPVSRKPGSSKRKLERAMPILGIHYIHCAELGTPSRIRNAYVRSGEVGQALLGYQKYLRTHTLSRLLHSQVPCLLCLEADYRLCHRSIIAQILTEMTGCRTIHLHQSGEGKRFLS